MKGASAPRLALLLAPVLSGAAIMGLELVGPPASRPPLRRLDLRVGRAPRHDHGRAGARVPCRRGAGRPPPAAAVGLRPPARGRRLGGRRPPDGGGRARRGGAAGGHARPDRLDRRAPRSADDRAGVGVSVRGEAGGSALFARVHRRARLRPLHRGQPRRHLRHRLLVDPGLRQPPHPSDPLRGSGGAGHRGARLAGLASRAGGPRPHPGGPSLPGARSAASPRHRLRRGVALQHASSSRTRAGTGCSS